MNQSEIAWIASRNRLGIAATTLWTLLWLFEWVTKHESPINWTESKPFKPYHPSVWKVNPFKAKLPLTSLREGFRDFFMFVGLKLLVSWVDRWFCARMLQSSILAALPAFGHRVSSTQLVRSGLNLAMVVSFVFFWRILESLICVEWWCLRISSIVAPTLEIVKFPTLVSFTVSIIGPFVTLLSQLLGTGEGWIENVSSSLQRRSKPRCTWEVRRTICALTPRSTTASVSEFRSCVRGSCCPAERVSSLLVRRRSLKTVCPENWSRA